MVMRYVQMARLTRTAGVTTVAFSSAGSLLASGALDGRVCIWRVRDYFLLHMFSSNVPILSLVWAGDKEDTVICGLQDGTIVLLTITEVRPGQGDLIVTGFWAHGFPIECLAHSDGLFATGAQEEIRVWRAYSADWAHEADIPPPPKMSFNRLLQVLVTSLHWVDADGNPALMVAYMNHGVQ
ncbi:hypothetical protein TRAPUB_8053 [Trametes pubescens]|uniref:Uncharacterized protein n=1 Tax=Trametes pubescens TaxID=154538 RepID=A0A1M2W6D6_TRAPU|nr:hypothetical protein TRAPUB_8053 [Trametes pubescens]